MAALAASCLPWLASETLAQETANSGATVKASIEDGLAVESADHNFSTSLRVLARFRYQLDVTATGDVVGNNFSMPMVRPQLRAAFWRKKVDLFVQPELAGSGARLLDAQLTWNGAAEYNVRVGQFVTPMTRDFWTPVPAIPFPDFSITHRPLGPGADADLVSVSLAESAPRWSGSNVRRRRESGARRAS